MTPDTIPDAISAAYGIAQWVTAVLTLSYATLASAVTLYRALGTGD